MAWHRLVLLAAQDQIKVKFAALSGATENLENPRRASIFYQDGPGGVDHSRDDRT
jgi:hypothetical protein